MGSWYNQWVLDVTNECLMHIAKRDDGNRWKFTCLEIDTHRGKLTYRRKLIYFFCSLLYLPEAMLNKADHIGANFRDVYQFSARFVKHPLVISRTHFLHQEPIGCIKDPLATSLCESLYVCVQIPHKHITVQTCSFCDIKHFCFWTDSNKNYFLIMISIIIS